MKTILFYGILLRLSLLLYGHIQDQHPVLKYTDVDYQVFSDAAGSIAIGKSPYTRATYRYTPLLALTLLPNIYWGIWGKVLFAFCDCICGILLYGLLKGLKVEKSKIVVV